MIIDTSADDDNNPQYQTSDFRVFYMKARLQAHCLLSSSLGKARLSLLRPGVLWAGAGSHGAAQQVWLLCAGYSVLQTLLP